MAVIDLYEALLFHILTLNLSVAGVTVQRIEWKTSFGSLSTEFTHWVRQFQSYSQNGLLLSGIASAG